MFARRASWASLFAAALLLGAVEWHPAAEPLHALAPHAGDVYFPSASHPGQPTHLEAAKAAEPPASAIPSSPAGRSTTSCCAAPT